ncbi:MAG: PASTA domain-containing protein, partial [Oscillospiraceae bacterium]|nr:PASTA domain-containing protein [Oscillospiraceae bacterium]
PPPPPWVVGKMPNIIGLTYEECEETYSDFFELVVEERPYSSEYPEGAIIEQKPSENSEYLIGRTTVRCKISKGVRMVTVSNVIGLDFEDAKEILGDNDKFVVGFVSEYSDDVPKGKVIATDPPEFEKAAYGSAVKVTVSGGKEPDDTE